MHKTRRKLINKLENNTKERKLKVLFEIDKETKNQYFLPSTEKISMQKETRITQEKKDSKQHRSLIHSKSKTNQSLHMKIKCIFPIPMNNIYKKEKEVSSKENNVKSKERNTNSL